MSDAMEVTRHSSKILKIVALLVQRDNGKSLKDIKKMMTSLFPR